MVLIFTQKNNFTKYFRLKRRVFRIETREEIDNNETALWKNLVLFRNYSLVRNFLMISVDNSSRANIWSRRQGIGQECNFEHFFNHPRIVRKKTDILAMSSRLGI